MFSESMLETSWDHRSRRSWTTLTSFGLQVLAMGLLLMLPLMRPVGLPAGHSLPTPLTWGPPPSIRMAERPVVRTAQSNFVGIVLIAPRATLPTIEMVHDSELPPSVNISEVGVRGAGTGNPSPNGVPYSIPDSLSHAALPAKPAPSVPTHPVRLSHMDPGMLIRKVQPQYPGPAKSARVDGKVELAAIISKDGSIENLRVLAGHPMLVRAAIDAVKQWRYRPYILNNEPVEVETQITVNFSLSAQ
jgi:protein TonB